MLQDNLKRSFSVSKETVQSGLQQLTELELTFCEIFKSGSQNFTRFPAEAMDFSSLRPTKAPLEWVPGVIFLGAKQPKCEDNASNPISAEDKNEGSYTCNSAYAFMVRTGTTLQNILVHYTYGRLGWGVVLFVVC